MKINLKFLKPLWKLIWGEVKKDGAKIIKEEKDHLIDKAKEKIDEKIDRVIKKA